jgi:glycosyltransferase involved in cell wall biosynthesis
MRILWISLADLHGAGSDTDSVNASARYRMLLPAQQLKHLGHDVNKLNPRTSMQYAEHALAEADAVVFSKLLADPSGSYESAIRFYGALLGRTPPGTRVVLDVNDDHFDVPAFRAFYAARTPSAWVTSSEEMAQVLQEITHAPAKVVPDPYEGPQGLPQPVLPSRYPKLFRLLDGLMSSRQERWRIALLWFGHPAGLPQLRRMLPELEEIAGRSPLHLHCMTAPGHGLEDLCTEQIARPATPLTMSFEAWSKDATWRALQGCDLVLLPADLASQRTRVKSANRLIEAIRSGRFAVAHPLPAYRELGEYAFVGTSLAEGIAWAVNHPAAVIEKLARGQQYILDRFSPEVIARRWLEMLRV